MSLNAVCRMHSALRLLCAASLERAAYLQGEQAQHHVFCVAAESVAWRTRGRRVEGHGTFRGAVVEGEDARSKCWVLYNNDGFSGGAATRLSMMLNGRWSAEHARSHERDAGRAKQCDRGCRWWQHKHAAAAAAFFYDLRGRDSTKNGHCHIHGHCCPVKT